MHALVALGPAAVEALISLLEEDDDKTVSQACEVLGKIGDERAVEPLLKRLANASVAMHGHVTSALAKIGNVQAIEGLVGVLEDATDPEKRADAAGALGVAGRPAAIEALVKALDDEDWRVRSSSVYALVRLQCHPMCDMLVHMLNERPVGVAKAAAWGLGEIGDLRAIEPLVALIAAEDCSELGWVANEALEKIRQRQRR
jgi:HEAT repeat protein